MLSTDDLYLVSKSFPSSNIRSVSFQKNLFSWNVNFILCLFPNSSLVSSTSVVSFLTSVKKVFICACCQQTIFTLLLEISIVKYVRKCILLRFPKIYFRGR